MNYTYEPSTGRLATVTDGTDTFTYAYANNSNLLASLIAPQHTVAYSYETNRDLMTSVDNQVSGSSYSKYAYTYDELGRRADREQSGSAFAQTNKDTFAYNSRSEVEASINDVLTSAEYTPTYTYDQIGNRQSSTGVSPVSSYTANELNQYSAIDSTNPVHDADGNLTSDGRWTYTWNGENRLASATDGSKRIDFTYDYHGRLVKKDDGTEIEVYLYDGWNRIAKFELNSSFVILNSLNLTSGAST